MDTGFTHLKRVIDVAIINQCTCMSDEQLRNMVAALRIQIHEHFAPIWGIDSTLWYISADAMKNPKYALDQQLPFAWYLFCLDDTDEADALGYHDITAKGMPIGKCFLKTDIDAGMSPTVTVSHELLEMLADPWIQNCVFVQTSDTKGTIVALEVADACEDDQFGYEITIPNGAIVKVSDFVTPAYFMAGSPILGAPLDYEGHLKQPLSLLPGGYLSTFAADGKGWTQITAQKTGTNRLKKAHVSRFARRKAGKYGPEFDKLGEIQRLPIAKVTEADAPASHETDKV